MADTVLLVDDDAVCRRVTKKFLEANGYHVAEFEDARSVVNAVEDGLDFQIAILDRSLAGYLGEEVGDFLRRTCPQNGIISYSGYPDKPSYADSYLLKPARLEELLKLVRSQCDTRNPEQ